MAFIDLEGETLHGFFVVGRHSVDNKGRVKWSCQCLECSSIQVVRSDAVRRGTACRSCRKTKAATKPRKKYGRARERKPRPEWYGLGREYRSEYLAFCNAKGRCENPAHPGWPRYGGRGIRFGYANFKQFLDDIGPRPDGLELDRIDNNQGYTVGNCRWTTKRTNMLNRELSVRVQYQGCTRPLCDVLEELGLTEKRSWIDLRLARGYSFEETLENLVKGNTKFGYKEMPAHTSRLMAEPLDEMTVEYYSLPKNSKGHSEKGWLENMARFYNLKTCTVIRRAERHIKKYPHLEKLVPCDVSRFGCIDLRHSKDNGLSRKAKDILAENDLNTRDEIVAAIKEGKLDPALIDRKYYGIRTYRDICNHFGVDVPVTPRKPTRVKQHKYIPRAALIAEIERLRARLSAQLI